jgi:hypothetical protein
LRKGFELVGSVLRDVAPEEDLAVQRLEVGDDLLDEVEVDGCEAAGVDVGLGAAEAEIDGFVAADVQERAGIQAASSVNMLWMRGWSRAGRARGRRRAGFRRRRRTAPR